MAPLRRLSRPAGFTLIELIVAITISLMVAALIYQVFIDQTKAFRRQADMGAMQQNLRLAMEIVTRDLGSAGFGLAYDGAAWGVDGQSPTVGTGDDNARLYGMRIIDDFPVGSGHDAVEVFTLHPDRTTWAYTDPTNPMACDATTIQFAPGYDTQSTLYSAGGANSHIVCYAPVQSGRPAAYIWQVNGAGGGSAVPVSANTQTDYLVYCPTNASLPMMMVCAPARYGAYYVDDQSGDGIGLGSTSNPTLYYTPSVLATRATGGYPDVNDIPIAMGIEDMQFEVCLGGNGIDCELDANWTTGGELGGGVEWQHVASVRVKIAARTSREDAERSTVSAPSDLVLSDAYSPPSATDGYHRRTAQTEVAMRNATGMWQMLHASW